MFLTTAPNSEEEVEADFMVAFRDAFDVLVDSTNSFDQLSRSCGEARFSWLPFPAGQTDWFTESAMAHPDDPMLENSLRYLSITVNELIGVVPAHHIILVGQGTGAAMAAYFTSVYPLSLGGVMTIGGWDTLANVTPKIADVGMSRRTQIRTYGERSDDVGSIRSIKTNNLPRVGHDLLTDLLLLLTRPLCAVIWLTPTTHVHKDNPAVTSVWKISHVIEDLMGSSVRAENYTAFDESLEHECGGGVAYRTVQIPIPELSKIRDGNPSSSVDDVLREFSELINVHRVRQNRIIIGGSHGAEEAVLQLM
ncbi:hypothetical protein Pmar_PMAR003686 [Perkinsus marinus ATCC 50983]|uniref:Phospholipase/carboxylesterase/thioesterase domain-containing protein n=1 Tax=Perkinsus marinus (strain ATCC 50983 / TXsc) TaxID=423536 RepID=C5KI11_PERM5|nr:hypothetical protein Pmar_PMAR003686 [Perkinsus marinus ATCC 50983]EER16223.1 hypothetical protein Pmar_PMAR003686 [Perkinsus marinus ATCC 50983]|eukprot:XP_002784427.1 hypothetical protein Pmar_PMAR003686 [Perkinsus marinus ATCC 50983]